MAAHEKATRAPLAMLAVIGILLAHFFALCVLLFDFVKVVPVLSTVCEEFQIPLPAMTELVITMSNYAVRYWYALILVALVTDVVIVCLLASLPRSVRWVLWTYSHFVLLSAVFFLALTSMCWGLTISKLFHGLQGEGAAAGFEQ